MPSLFILLLSLGVSLRFSYNSSNGADAGAVPSPPPTPPYPHHHHHQTPGNKVVVVVHNDPGSSHSKLGSAPIPRPLASSEGQRKEKRSNRKSILLPAGINRQGFILTKPSLDDTSLLKKRKGSIQKFVQSSPRHISGLPSDLFGKSFHIHKTGTSFGDKINGNSPSIMEFRPHQPDITPDAQGKLSLPVGYGDDILSGMKHISPTPMANQINPYTNGVASSFPPGIDPYEGFIRYAAENLESPMGNIIDYHSLEHYYGPQHPLSPHQNLINTNVGKENNLDKHPYADSFPYNGGRDSDDIGNSPPLASPPPPVATAGNNLDGFRARDNPDSNGPGSGLGGNSGYNSVSSYEHGIDHFHAPSPGLGAAPPIPRYAATTEPSSYEDDNENAPPSPPYGNMPSRGPYPGKPQNSPFQRGQRIPPPDLKVFEEGPPPELLHGLGNSGPQGAPGHGGPQYVGAGPPDHDGGPQYGGAGPPDHDRGPQYGGGPHHAAGPRGPPPPHQQEHQHEHQHEHQPPHSESEQATPQDGGDDSIWGILDIAEMLEKGQIPGSSNDKNTANSPGANGRVVIPARAGAAPPKTPYGIEESSSSSSFDYDDGGADPGEGGNQNPAHLQQYAPPESQEQANDYEDQYSK